MRDFELSFSNFIDCKEYDQADAALFSLVRLAFKEGWLAAGGKLPKDPKVKQMHRSKYVDLQNASEDNVVT